ncbi:MAG: hypothetical protein WAU91_12335 [Desulfatitalea sp.]
MTAIAHTPLEAWISARIGLEAGKRPTPERLAAWQLERLNETLSHAHGHSPFYQRQWGTLEAPRLRRMEEIGSLPFTSDEVLRRDALQLLCVSQSEVARVVTLNTSGTTGEPKRIFFSEGDLEATVDFFHHGMSTLVRPGERVLILLPGERPDSVGDLLRKGLARLGVEGIVHGPVQDPAHTLQAIIDPVTAEPVRRGRTGEVVFTTLARRAMPLIRYRTGDLAAWIDEPCPCGSVLRRMGPVQGRRKEMVRLADGIVLGMNALDEALFNLPGVVDFATDLGYDNGSSHLRIKLYTRPGHPEDIALTALAALQKIPAIRAAAAIGALLLDPIAIAKNLGPAAGPAKRRIVDRRTTDPNREEC